MAEQKWRSYYEYLNEGDLDEIKTEYLNTTFIYGIAFQVIDRFLTVFPIQEAGEIKVKPEPFPLYYFAPTGSAVISLEGVRLYQDLEQSFDRVENAPIAYGDADTIDGLE
ncbi:hypothetical protein [Alteribacter populi]|uniref:hypothetical protein n=1 Tax=Alteribacter populi TaxID=2011011 RepID=UPI000BBA6786|nr:hypothetical protein [Alteribacter populi]